MSEHENKNDKVREESVATYYFYEDGEVKSIEGEGQDLGFGCEQSYSSLSAENERILRERREREEYIQKRKYNRTPLMLSIIGMMLSIFCGIGIALAIPSFIMSVSRLKAKPSKPLKWALAISAVTIFVSALIIVCFSYALVTGLIEYFELIEGIEGAALSLICA